MADSTYYAEDELGMTPEEATAKRKMSKSSDDPLHRLRFKRGEQLSHNKLTARDVKWIREQVEERERLRHEANKMSNAKLAEKLGVHQRTVDRVISYQNWSHVA